MRRRWTGLAILLFAAHGAGALGLDVGIRSAAGMHAADDPRFALGGQFLFSAGTVAELVSAVGLGAGAAFDLVVAAPSPVVDLVSYRGYFGPRASVFVSLWSAGSPLAAGLRVGAWGALLRYSQTDRYFVSPGLFVEPGLRLTPARADWLRLALTLPISISWRADLVFSGEASLALSVGVGFRR